MALRERIVKGTVVDGDGEPVKRSKLKFKISVSLAYTVTHVVVNRQFETVTNDDGEFSISLWCDEDSLVPVNYNAFIPVADDDGSDELHLATFSLSYDDGSDIYLPEIINAGIPAPSEEDYLYSFINQRIQEAIDSLPGGGGGGTAIGTVIAGAVAKGILYIGAGGVLAQDVNNFSWDYSTRKMTIKNASNAVSAVFETDDGAYYYAKIQFKQGANTATIGGDYNGDLLFTAPSGKYVSFGLQGVMPILRVNSYSYGANAAPNDDLVRISAGAATDKLLKLVRHSAQSQNLFEMVSNDGTTVLSSFNKDGVWQPATVSDANAPNNSIYLSSTTGSLSYKRAGGTVAVIVA